MDRTGLIRLALDRAAARLGSRTAPASDRCPRAVECRVFVRPTLTTVELLPAKSLILNPDSHVQGNEITILALKTANHRSDL